MLRSYVVSAVCHWLCSPSITMGDWQGPNATVLWALGLKANSSSCVPPLGVSNLFLDTTFIPSVSLVYHCPMTWICVFVTRPVPTTQQCRAIRLYLGNLYPQSVPSAVTIPAAKTDMGVTQLVLHLDTIDKAQRWLA